MLQWNVEEIVVLKGLNAFFSKHPQDCLTLVHYHEKNATLCTLKATIVSIN